MTKFSLPILFINAHRFSFTTAKDMPVQRTQGGRTLITQFEGISAVCKYGQAELVKLQLKKIGLFT